MADIVSMLSKQEIELLKALYKIKDSGKASVSDDELLSATGMQDAGVKRTLMYLDNKKLVTITRDSSTGFALTERGKAALKSGLPETRLFSWIKSKKEVPIQELEKSGLDKGEVNIAFGELKRADAVQIRLGMVSASGEYKPKNENALRAAADGKPIDNADELARRGLIEKREKETLSILLTELAIEMRKSVEKTTTDFIDTVTRETIAKGDWKRKRFKGYDVASPVPDTWGGSKHPLRVVWENVRDVFREMGFQEMRGDWVDLVFWNMDSMFIPQDHPARDVQDTFYLDAKGKVDDKQMLKRVKEVHETGGKTGSKGWQSPWDPESPMQLIMRTHTTCLSFRTIAAGIKPPVKYFSIGRVFRNEAVDRFHLPEFHQIEGFVAAEDITIRDMFGYIAEFYEKMGIKKLRFKPTYNPYTEPSAEIFGYHEGMKKWLEVGNSGMFRPESLAPYDTKVPVVAWGLALERLAMFIYKNNDIRELTGHTCDVNWLRSYPMPVLKF